MHVTIAGEGFFVWLLGDGRDMVCFCFYVCYYSFVQALLLLALVKRPPSVCLLSVLTFFCFSVCFFGAALFLVCFGYACAVFFFVCFFKNFF